MALFEEQKPKEVVPEISGRSSVLQEWPETGEHPMLLGSMESYRVLYGWSYRTPPGFGVWS